MKYDAVVFDLLTALIDSWRLWNSVAGSPEAGMVWRRRYLEITYGCGNGSGGSEVEFAVGEQKQIFKVEQTGGFQAFVKRELGELIFDQPGRYTLTVKPKAKPGPAVMDLPQVALKPVK